MKITEYLSENILFLDGGMGTVLQERGLGAGELPELWNINHPEDIRDIHRAYFDAGSNVVNTNTFGANSLKFTADVLEDIVRTAIENARAAAHASSGKQEKWVALDIGPIGRVLKPYGDLDFEEAVEIFAKTVRLGVKYGCDLIFIETMADSYETKAALLAAKENSSVPVFVSNAYGEDGKLLTGASAAAMVALLEGMGADAIGVNCSLGPRSLRPVIEEYLKYASVPVILKPNAGLPRSEGGRTYYGVGPHEFAEEICELVSNGVSIVGGCCGTTPLYISAINERISGITPPPVSKKRHTLVSSYTHAVELGKEPVLIGERINPTGKKRFKEALLQRDIGYILKEGIAQQERGVHVLDVNVGLPEIDEADMLLTAVRELQAIIDLPLQIDTSNAEAMEAALRLYNGKPMINSVNGNQESMDSIFPLAKKYGGVIVALTLDECGIPPTAEGRVAIARKILCEAEKHGIDKKDIIFDPLALAISTDKSAAGETLRAINIIKNDLGCNTLLGISNVSFGLPERDAVNANFFALALANGLSAAIMNPYSNEMMKTYFACSALFGLDDKCQHYLDFAESLPKCDPSPAAVKKSVSGYNSELERAIMRGLSNEAARLTEELIKTKSPLDIVEGEIIPALDRVGVGFEQKTVYLPGLLMSAEAASSAFEVVKSRLPSKKASDKCALVIATVKGDIHDIGKNIVKLLLENYGFSVTDLGRDVPPERIISAAKSTGAKIIGLSALMTTTVAAMEQTIRLAKAELPEVKIVVGGAVLTKEYAKSIGADKYAKDAMETVRYAEEINAASCK
ncbi:MAG: homocysteine methyltransferase [Ruminococcaceae bacterium]|nr:homocysteine methyltransferase [Oscillospiraceae bacterium]